MVLRWDGDVNDVGGGLKTAEEQNGMKGNRTTGQNCVKRNGATFEFLIKLI